MKKGSFSQRPTRNFLLMADGAVEEQFPQLIVAAEEAQVAPGQAAPAPRPRPVQLAHNEAQNAEFEVNYLSYVFGFWLVHNLRGSMFPWYVTQLPRLLRSFNHLEMNLVTRVSCYVGVGSWAVRDFSHATSWVSWALLSIATLVVRGLIVISINPVRVCV